MKTKAILTTLGFSTLLLILIAAWWATNQKGFSASDPVDNNTLKNTGCADTSLKLYKIGDWESAESTFEYCKFRNDVEIFSHEKIKSEQNAIDEFLKYYNGWVLPWPDNDGNIEITLSPEEASGRINQARKIINSYPGTYAAELCGFIESALYFYLGRYDQLYEIATRHGTENPAGEYIELLKIIALFKSQQFEAVIREAKYFDSKYYNSIPSIEVKMWVSRAYKAQGNIQSAISTAIEAASCHGDPFLRARAIESASGMYLEIGRQPEAAKMMLEIARYYPDIETESNLGTLLDEYQDQLSYDDRIMLSEYFLKKELGYSARKFLTPVKKDLEAKGLLLLAKAELLSGNNKNASEIINHILKSKYPDEFKVGACLLNSKIFIKKKQYSQAIAFIEKNIKEFPSGNEEFYSLLSKAAFLKGDQALYIQSLEAMFNINCNRIDSDISLIKIARWYLINGNPDKAYSLYSKFDELYPRSFQRAESLFWRAKILLSQNKNDMAVEMFGKLQAEFPYSYFNFRSGQILESIGIIDNSDFRGKHDFKMLISNECDTENGNMFLRLKLTDKAEKEFSAVKDKCPNEASIGLSKTYLMEGNYPLSVKSIELRVIDDPAFYFRVMNDKSLVRLLYPNDFLNEILLQCEKYNMNPVWPLSIIRQESRFQKDAKSVSNAMGLMQIIPSTGKWIAQNLKFKNYKNAKLFDATTNIKFGTWYFDYLLKKFNNQNELAVAAYNGGPGNTSKWIEAYPENDMDIFIEMIPRDETRGYVKKVMHNYYIYSILNY